MMDHTYCVPSLTEDMFPKLCEYCSKNMGSIQTYRAHVKKFHPGNVKTKQTRFKCNECSKFYKTRKTLISHMKKFHSIILKKSILMKSAMPTVNCALCEEKILLPLINYIQHLATLHHKPVVVEEYNFKSLKEFHSWKSNQQFMSKQLYRKQTANSYTCSHNCKLKKTGKTRLHCPSRMYLKINKDGHVKLTFNKTHIGHKKWKKSATKSKQEIDEVISLVNLGLDNHMVENQLRNSSESYNLQTISMKSICNINRKRRLFQNEFKYLEYLTGLGTQWVRSFSYYLEPETGEILDFSLVLFSESQIECMKKHGPNVISCDSTPGTNRYRLLLTSILVLDENRHGVPVAFFLSLKTNTDAMLHFFYIVKKFVGEIKTDAFVSDREPTFYNAWCATMPKPNHRLLCSYHVTAAWLKNLNLVPSDKRNIVKFKLFDLLKELDKLKFEEKLNQFENYLTKNELNSFYQYFFSNYVKKLTSKPKFWAYSYRLKKLNTNCHIEDFYRNLKGKPYLNRKMVRLDECVDHLYNFQHHYNEERSIAACNRNNSSSVIYKTSMMKKFHRLGSGLNNNGYVTFDSNTNLFTVKELITPAKQRSHQKVVAEIPPYWREFRVQRSEHICDKSCLESIDMCHQCKICIDTYECIGCIEYLFRNNMCSHVHAVNLFVTYAQLSCVNQISNDEESDNVNLVLEVNLPVSPSLKTDVIEKEVNSNIISNIGTKLLKFLNTLSESEKSTDELNFYSKQVDNLLSAKYRADDKNIVKITDNSRKLRNQISFFQK